MTRMHCDGTEFVKGLRAAVKSAKALAVPRKMPKTTMARAMDFYAMQAVKMRRGHR